MLVYNKIRIILLDGGLSVTISNDGSWASASHSLLLLSLTILRYVFIIFGFGRHERILLYLQVELAPYPVFKYPEYPSTEHSGSVPAATSLPAGGHLPRQPAAPLLLPRPVPPCLGQRGRRRALTPGSSWSWPLLYPRVRGGVLDPVQPKRAPGVFSVYSRDREEKARSASPSPFSLSPFPRCNRQILLPSRAGPRRSTWG